MPVELDIGDFTFLPVQEAVSPSKGGFFMHYVDYWWAVHPEKGLAFYNPLGRNGRRRRSGLGAPQCNTDERISRVVGENAPWAVEMRKLSSAWVPARPEDYC